MAAEMEPDQPSNLQDFHSRHQDSLSRHHDSDSRHHDSESRHQHYLSHESGEQQNSRHLNTELLEESVSGKGNAIECKMSAEIDRYTDRNSQHQDSDSRHQNSDSRHQDSHRRHQDSYSHHQDSYSHHQDSHSRHQDVHSRDKKSHSPVSGGQQKRESGSLNRKGIVNQMASETDRYSEQYIRHQDSHSHHRDSHSPVPGAQQKSPQLTLVLLGETGSGKSASGNTILGEKAFKSEPSSMPVTTECKMETKSIRGTKVKVIDTPDFFDEDLQDKKRHIQRCRELCGQKGGLCVYLLVIQIGRFTEGERDILERLEKALETRVRDRAIILFTHGDDLKSHIDEFVRNTSPFLKELIRKCGGRYQKFDNTTLFSQQPNEKSSSGWFKSLLGIGNPTSHKREVEKQVEKQVEELMGKIAELV